MPYKISGTLSDAARIIIIKESDWSIESNTTESVGAYEIDSLVSAAKLVAARKSDGESLVYGNVTPEYYALPPGDRGVFGGGDSTKNVIDYITISTPGDATDFGDLTVDRHNLAATSNGAADRGVFGGGKSGSETNSIEYITIPSTGDATDFGDLTVARDMLAATSNGTSDRAIFGGGSSTVSIINVIDYITISTPGDATDFGDLTAARGQMGTTSNGTNDRGVFGGGRNVGGTEVNNIDYITISSASDATNFGDLTVTRQLLAATSNSTNDRGVFGGGHPGPENTIDYITISTTGDATDFGDLAVARRSFTATSNGTNDKGVFGGGYSTVTEDTIDYITISSTGDATDFGDLTVARYWSAATSNA